MLDVFVFIVTFQFLKSLHFRVISYLCPTSYSFLFNSWSLAKEKRLLKPRTLFCLPLFLSFFMSPWSWYCGRHFGWMNEWMLRIVTPHSLQSHCNCYLPACSFSKQSQLSLLHSPPRPYFQPLWSISGFFPELSWNYRNSTHSAYQQVSKHFKIKVNAVLFAWTFQALIK